MADKYAKHKQVDQVGLEIKADYFTGLLNGSVQDPDVIAINNLTDSSGGTSGGDTVPAVANIALSTSNTYTDAAVNTAVNTALTSVRNDIATLAAKVNALLTALKN